MAREYVKTYTYRGWTIGIANDLMAINPRVEWDLNCIILARTASGRDVEDLTAQETLAEVISPSPILPSAWDGVEGWYKKSIVAAKAWGVVILPFKYIGEGEITLGSIDHAWDTDEDGIVFMKIEEVNFARSNGLDPIDVIKDSIDEFNKYLVGDVWGYELFSPGTGIVDGDSYDSCWGYLGLDYIDDEAVDILAIKVAEEHGKSIVLKPVEL